MTTLGIAMLARNAETMIPTALDPWAGLVDEISIVLGGISTDNTPDVAAKYADHLQEYDGALDDDGRLMDFAAARTQSFKPLTSDWVIVVDTDDVWHNTEQVHAVIKSADDYGAGMIEVVYLIDGLEMVQPRIYRRGSGHWKNAIHEAWTWEKGKAIKTNQLWLEQVRGEEAGKERAAQNVAIAEALLAGGQEDKGLLGHLAKDLVNVGRMEEAIQMAERYQIAYQQAGKHHPQELASVLYHKAGAECDLGRQHNAMYTLLSLLATQNITPGWALLGEVFYEMGGEALYELSVMCSDRAIAGGKSRVDFATDNRMSISGAAVVKALALKSLGREREALRAVDLALMVKADHKEANELRLDLCQTLQVLP